MNICEKSCFNCLHKCVCKHFHKLANRVIIEDETQQPTDESWDIACEKSELLANKCNHFLIEKNS